MTMNRSMRASASAGADESRPATAARRTAACASIIGGVALALGVLSLLAGCDTQGSGSVAASARQEGDAGAVQASGAAAQVAAAHAPQAPASSSSSTIAQTGQVVGSGNPGTDVRVVAAFDRLVVSGAIEVVVVVGSPQSVTVTADDNIIPLIVTEVRDGQLVLEHTSGYRTMQRPFVAIVVPGLTSIEARDATQVMVSDLQGETVRIMGSSAATVTVAGTADHVMIDAADAAAVHLDELVARAVSVQGSGAARIAVFPLESLTGDLTSAASVVYRGSPAVSVTTSAAATVSQR